MSTKRKYTNKVWIVTTTEVEDEYHLPGDHECHTKIKLFAGHEDAENYRKTELRRLLVDHAIHMIYATLEYPGLSLGRLLKEELCGIEKLDDWENRTTQIVKDLEWDKVEKLYEESVQGTERYMSVICIKEKNVR